MSHPGDLLSCQRAYEQAMKWYEEQREKHQAAEEVLRRAKIDEAYERQDLDACLERADRARYALAAEMASSVGLDPMPREAVKANEATPEYLRLAAQWRDQRFAELRRESARDPELGWSGRATATPTIAVTLETETVREPKETT